jgi:hypothetical protein
LNKPVHGVLAGWAAWPLGFEWPNTVSPLLLLFISSFFSNKKIKAKKL